MEVALKVQEYIISTMDTIIKNKKLITTMRYTRDKNEECQHKTEDKEKKYIIQDERKNVASKLAILFMLVYYIMPQYFGIDIKLFDLSAQRIVVIIFVLFILESRIRVMKFWDNIVKSPGIIWLLLYFVVLAYTAALRTHLGTFFYSFLDFIAFFSCLYIIKNELGIRKTIQLLNAMGMFLCILGILEYVLKVSPFSYLETLEGMYGRARLRAGSYRIMGPANHSLGYGLMLVTMVPFACLDTEKDEIDLFSHFFYLVLIAINVFLTSSRSTLAVFGLMIIILFFLCNREQRKKAILLGLSLLLIMVFVLIATRGSSFSNYIMLQITSVLDELLGTTYAAMYGADMSWLSSSSNYRDQLPYIFKIGLNPILGKGSQARFGWVINGWAIQSLDNFYVAQFVRYAYPGLFTYCMYVISYITNMIKSAIILRSGLFTALLVGVVMYYVNLWWVDGLMTYKYVYILLAVFASCFDDERKQFIPYAEMKQKGENGTRGLLTE